MKSMQKEVEEFRKIKKKIAKKDYDVRYDTIYNTRALAHGAERAFYDLLMDGKKDPKIVAMHEHSYYAWFLSENYPKAKVTWLSTGAPAFVERSFLRKGINYKIVMTPLVYPNAKARSLPRQDLFVAESWYFEPVLASVSILSFMELLSKTRAPKSVLYCMAPFETRRTSCLNAAWDMLYKAAKGKIWVVPILHEDEFCMVRAYIDAPVRVPQKDINNLRKHCFTANHRGTELVRSLLPQMVSDMKTAYVQLVAHLRGKIDQVPESPVENDLFFPEERMAVPSLVSSYMFFDRRTLVDDMRPLCYLQNLGDAVEDIRFLTLHATRGDRLAYFGCAHEDIPCVLASLFPEISEIHVFGSEKSRLRKCKGYDRVFFHSDETVSCESVKPDLVISTKRCGWFQGLRFASTFLPRAISTDISVPPSSKGVSPTNRDKGLRFKKGSGNPDEHFFHLEGEVSQKVFRPPGSDECRVVATRNNKNKYDVVFYNRKGFISESEKFNNMRFLDRVYVYGKVPPLPAIPGHDRSLDFHKYQATVRGYLASRVGKNGDIDEKSSRLMRSINKRIAPDLLRCVYRRWCAAPSNKYSRVWLEAWKNRTKDYVVFMEGIVGTRGKKTFDAQEVEQMKKELEKMRRLSPC